jgi:hypothetical protein
MSSFLSAAETVAESPTWISSKVLFSSISVIADVSSLSSDPRARFPDHPNDSSARGE